MESNRKTFTGFEPLTANYIYCPNQFFDVCLPTCSRGTIRVVAYVLRQTLGWLDPQGNPIQQDIVVSYNDLIQKAGVSRGAIGPALAEACKLNLLRRMSTAVACSKGNGGRSASYSLRWDDGDQYQKHREHFAGFFRGVGHCTPVPNQFFDLIVRQESRSVIKVVATVIRHTIGYQNQFGGRRTSAPLSHTYIGRYANLSEGRVLSQAIQQAESVGYIACVQAGSFNHDHKKREAAQYSVRWISQPTSGTSGSKKPTAEQFKKASSSGSQKPAPNQFKKASNRKTSFKDTDKQQHVAAAKAVQSLRGEGFDEATATRLVANRGVEIVTRQLDWLEARNPRDNRAGMLRKAIDENWTMPASIQCQKRQESSRQRQTAQDAIRSREDAKIAALKKERAIRKEKLQILWDTASNDQRSAWIRKAVKAESSKMIADLIRRQRPSDSMPRSQVLEAIAREKHLPSIATAKSEATATGSHSID